MHSQCDSAEAKYKNEPKNASKHLDQIPEISSTSEQSRHLLLLQPEYRLLQRSLFLSRQSIPGELVNVPSGIDPGCNGFNLDFLLEDNFVVPEDVVSSQRVSCSTTLHSRFKAEDTLEVL